MKCSKCGKVRASLLEAVRKGRRDLVESLLADKADVEVLSIDNETPLHLAVEYSPDLVELLLAHGANIEAKNKYGKTPLHTAVAYGQKDLVEFLLTHGAKIDAKSDSGRTPLHSLGLLSQSRCREVGELLIAYGAVVEAKDKDGDTPLHSAAFSGRTAALEFLLDRGAGIEAKNCYGCTPLHLAAYHAEVWAPELLLDRGAAIEAKDNDGRTPLHHAASGGNSGAVELLLARGADLSAKTSKGETPLQLAGANSKRDVAALLRAKAMGTTPCGKTEHVWVYAPGPGPMICSRCGEPRDLIGLTVVASCRSLEAPLNTASERDRCFLCVSRAKLGSKVFDGLYDGMWLIDGSIGTTAFFEIEKVFDETPEWVIAKYPRVADFVKKAGR